MNLLESVNAILPKLGEDRVTSLDEPNSSIGIILPLITIHRKALLEMGWTFNNIPMKIYKNIANGEYRVADNVLHFFPDDPSKARMFGRRIIDPSTGANPDGDEPISGYATMDMEFEELPENAARYVFYSAASEAFNDTLGAQGELAQWQQNALSSFASLTQTEQRSNNFRERRSYERARILAGWGDGILRWNGTNYDVI